MLHQEMVDFGRKFIGLKEYTGSSSNPVILKMANFCGFKYTDDNVSWCSLFMNYLAKSNGYDFTKNLSARSWLKIGKRIPNFVPGCIVVYWRDSYISGKGHVGIGISMSNNRIRLLSGNSSVPGQVTEHNSYPANQVLGYIELSKNGNFQPIDGNSAVNIYDKNESISDRKLIPNDTIILNNEKNITLKQFIDKNKIQLSEQELLSYEDNSSEIYKSYTEEQKNKYKKASIELIGFGARLKVPMYKIAAHKSIYAVNQTIIANTSYNCFIEGEIKALLNNPSYRKLNVNKSESEQKSGSIYKKINNCSVWIWSKVSDHKKGSHLIDVTPFIIDLSVSVGENGGNFNLKLPHITYNTKDNDEFDLPVDQIINNLYESYVSKNSSHTQENINSKKFSASFIDDNDELKANGKYFKRKNSFFHNVFQNNDLVFIRFEKLGTDKIFHQSIASDFLKINSNNLPNNTYDLIGLIDRNSLTSNASNSEQSVSIQGRDLSKLIIDDGVYFFPVAYAVQDSEQIIQNSSKNRPGKRIIFSNSNVASTTNTESAIQSDLEFNFFQTQSIEEWVTFIFSQLVNIDICPDSLFNAYKNKSFVTTRNDRIDLTGNFVYKQIETNGIWGIVKLVIDKEVGDRRLYDESLSTDTGSLINLIRKVCQKPFVDFFMDTYGDKYYFIIRKPPFSFKSFTTNFCINIFEDDIVTDSLDWEEEVYTWYRLEAMGSFVDQSNSSELINLPAVMFPEYVEIFGSKVLSVQSNYLDFDMSNSDLSTSNIEAMRKQSREDLDWLIETNCYLPFTRKGTITIKGDRRIKRGINIRHFGTGEIFHVDEVSNTGTYSDTSDRSTTIQVSRGMVEEHLEKYFKIIDVHHEAENNTWKVNQDIFNFFIQRKQFK